MRLGEHEFGTRELNALIERYLPIWDELSLAIESTPFRQLGLRERFRLDWPQEDALLRQRLARTRQLRDVFLRLIVGERVRYVELAECIDELLGVVLDSPWRAMHLALVHTYRWAGADDEQAGHDADISLASHGPASLAEHAYSVALVAIGVAARLGWSPTEVRHAGLTGLLQDVGTLLLPAQARPSGEPGDAITGAWQRHPALSLYTLRDLEGLPDAVRRGIHQHHERENGQGYPDRLPPARISPLAKVSALADAYMAPLEAVRGKPPALPRDAMLGLLAGMKDKQWESGCLRSLLAAVGLYPAGSVVRLNTGRKAVVLASPPDAPDRPIVLVLPATAGNALPVDLRQPENRGLRVRAAEPRWMNRRLPELSPFVANPLRASA